MSQMCAVMVNESRDTWDVHLPHVEFHIQQSCQQSHGARPELGAHEPPASLSNVDLTESVRSWPAESVFRYYLEYCNVAAEHQRRAYKVVREQQVLNDFKTER